MQPFEFGNSWIIWSHFYWVCDWVLGSKSNHVKSEKWGSKFWVCHNNHVRSLLRFDVVYRSPVPISFRFTPLILEHSHDCPGVNKSHSERRYKYETAQRSSEHILCHIYCTSGWWIWDLAQPRIHHVYRGSYKEVDRHFDGLDEIPMCLDIRDLIYLTHWGRVTYIGVSKLTIIGSDNGLSPARRQAINWINAGILLIGT